MGIILILVALVGLGIFLIIKFDSEIFVGMLTNFSFLALVVVIIVACIAQGGQPGTIAAYEQDKAYIQASIENDSITDGERSKVMDLMLENNQIITAAATWSGNFFVGAFYGADVGKLELFDFKQMQKAKLNVDLVGGKE